MHPSLRRLVDPATVGAQPGGIAWSPSIDDGLPTVQPSAPIEAFFNLGFGGSPLSLSSQQLRNWTNMCLRNTINRQPIDLVHHWCSWTLWRQPQWETRGVYSSIGSFVGREARDFFSAKRRPRPRLWQRARRKPVCDYWEGQCILPIDLL